VGSISSLGDPSKGGFVIPAEFVDIWKHAGFQKILFTFEADESKLVHSLSAVIDVYYVDEPSTGKGALKIGRVSYYGELVPGLFATSDPTWRVSLGHSLNYNPSNAWQLPKMVQEIGPGAFLMAVIQTIFGTSYGQQLCGLQDYHFPESK
jgi:hypothetical protein